MRTDYRTLDARAFGLAAGTIAAALTTLCSIGLALAPRFTTTVASVLIHIDLDGMSRNLTWGVYFGGLVGWTFGAGVVFWATAAIYNRFLKQASAIAVPAGSFAGANR